MRWLKSVRARLTLWYSFVLLTTLVAFGLIAYTYSSRQLAESLDRSLANEVRWVRNFIQPKANRVKPSKKFTTRQRRTIPPPDSLARSRDDEAEAQTADEEIWSQIYEHALLNPKKTLIEVTDKKGAIVFRSMSVAMESLMVAMGPLDSMNITTVKSDQGQYWRVAATETRELRIYAAYPLAELSDVLDNLFSILLILIPIALAVSVGGGLFLADKSLRPVDDITRAARQITAQHLDRQIPSPAVNDEIGRLILTFNEMIVRLRSSFDQIKQFTIDASHELRTPLTIMRGEVELALRQPKQAGEYRAVLVSNLEEIMRLSNIIENLMTLAKGDLGKHDVRFEEVSLAPLVAELFEDCRIIAANKNISVDFEKTEELTIIGDQLRLRQLFLNLLDNAIKYTPEGGRIEIALTRNDGYAVVSVSDNGVGISREDQERIFDRFYRADKARSRELGGSGLGLSIAKWVAELHKGFIRVSSEPSRGSSFAVHLPL